MSEFKLVWVLLGLIHVCYIIILRKNQNQMDNINYCAIDSIRNTCECIFWGVLTG